ncbi:MAG TPA: PEGA domain-containing protein [Verrucomicrobiae bacterium]|jgi:hypothetical protein|nr:PEGA domain-containing protein [Verrucomicrobiae bacterium]
MKRVIPIVVLLLAGCASKGPPTFSVQIESDPPGARIEVNNSYIGETPCTWTTGGNDDRSFAGGWVGGGQIIVVATPRHDSSSGLHRQEKDFNPSGFMKQGDHIPEKMFFDLHEQP